MSIDAREQIVTVARRAFYERGFDETSFADLARLSGIPKGNFYYHFRSKAELLAAVLEARKADAIAALEAWEQSLPSANARLKRFLNMMTAERDDLIRFGCPLGSLLTELGKTHDELHRQNLVIVDTYVEWLAKQFLSSGHTKASSRALALRLLSRCQGAVVLAHAYHDSKILRQEVRDIESWIDQQVDER